MDNVIWNRKSEEWKVHVVKFKDKVYRLQPIALKKCKKQGTKLEVRGTGWEG